MIDEKVEPYIKMRNFVRVLYRTGLLVTNEEPSITFNNMWRGYMDTTVI